MDEQVEKLVSMALSWLESGAIWAGEQVPLFLEEVLAWGLGKAIVGVVFGVIVAITGAILTKGSIKLYKKDNEGYSYVHSEWMIAVVLTPIISTGISLGLLIPNILNVIQICVAPRVWLIEYLQVLL